MARNANQFQTIRSEGALLPPDVLQAIASQKVDGVSPASYHLPPGTKLNEAIAHSWSVLQKYWKGFQEIRCRLPDEETGTEATNQNWLLPLFEELKYGRLVTTKAPEIDARTYPVERFYSQVPIHLIGCNLPLDRRTKGARGAATASPHSMIQEFLNRREESLLGFLSNGLMLRILRDNVSLSRQAYVEFDLEAMMEGEVYADFALLWMLCHQSRVEGDKPQDFWLEKWSQLAREQGTRVLSDLRVGVAKAIEALGRGFLAHPRNDWLRQQLQSGQLDKQEYYRQVLRIVYRLLFLFVAEDRGLLHGPDADPAACELYDTHYSTRRLRELADQIRGSKHADLWHSLSLVFDALGRAEGCPQLGLPALGSFLWRRSSTIALLGPARKGAEPVEYPAYITNDDLLSAVRALAFIEQGKARRSVDYHNLGSEELGSVYESLLELHPTVNIPGRSFALDIAAGHERKTTGSYYTPDFLVQCLLESALEPVVADRIKGKKSEEAAKAILDLKVCDPACGSGHFLIAAAHRLARHLARVRSGEAEPSPADHQHALRDVISHCIYGVDINPMAVELCKVSLWMEALEPGKPLSFLDHHIQCGNSLLGATPALLKQGIPDEAFEPVEGDDKKLCKEYKKQNRDERRGQKSLFAGGGKPWERMGDFAVAMASFDMADDDSLDSIRSKEERYAHLVGSVDYLSGQFWADTWCAAFFWKKTKDFDYAITEDVFRRIERNPHDCAPWMRAEIQRLAAHYRFFHWHMAFPQVFHAPERLDQVENKQTGWSGGFNVVLGNPPWERFKLMEKEFLSALGYEEIVRANSATRKRLLLDMAESAPNLCRSLEAAKRESNSVIQFVKSSGRYPLNNKGSLNTYALFAETGEHLVVRSGIVGLILPSGIASDETTKSFFDCLVASHRLRSLFDFENKLGIFPDVDSRVRFCLLTWQGIDSQYTETPVYVFFAHSVHDIHRPERRIYLSAESIAKVNPNTRSAPAFASSRDATINLHVYERFPILWNSVAEMPSRWDVSLTRMFHMSDDSDLFATREMLESRGLALDGNLFEAGDSVWVPLYEAKFLHQFDHRHADCAGGEAIAANQANELSSAEHADPGRLVIPRYWVELARLTQKLTEWREPSWIFAFRDVTRGTDYRTSSFCVLPHVAAGHTVSLMVPAVGKDNRRSSSSYLRLIANLNAFVFDYLVRQKLTGIHFPFYVLEQVPVIPCEFYDQTTLFVQKERLSSWIECRVMELTYTAWDLKAFAEECGWDGPPFQWDEARRIIIRSELDAAYFHLYGIARNDVDHILETFPIVRRRDEQSYGEYRTKRLVLELYDQMIQAIQNGLPYQSRLDPPPANPRVAHPFPRIAVATAEQREKAETVTFVQLVLQEWGQPVLRENLECALILALNSRLRQDAMGRSVPAAYQPGTARYIPRFDRRLEAWQRNGVVRVENRPDGQFVSLGSTQVLQTAVAANQQATARAAIAAWQALQDSRNLAYYMTQEDRDAVAAL